MRIVRRIARQQLVRERAQPVHVVGRHGWLAAQLLGACAEGRQRARRLAARLQHPGGGAEVRQLHAPVRVEQYVTGLEVAVDHATLVRVLERLRDLQQHRDDGEVAAAPQPAQIASAGQLHGQQQRAVLALRGKHLEDPGMIQAAGALVLVQQRGPRRGAAPGRGVQDLQRNVEPALRIMRAPHLALTAAAQPFVQSVAGLECASGIRGQRIAHGPSQCAASTATGSEGTGAGSVCSCTGVPFSSRYRACSILRHCRYCSSAVPVSLSVRPSTSMTCGATSD